VLAEGAGVSADAVLLTLTAGSVVVRYEVMLASAADAAASRDSLITGPLATPAALQTALTDRFAADGVDSAPAVEVQALTPPVAVSVEADDGDDSGVLFGSIAGGVGGVIAVVVCVALYLRWCKRDKPGSDTDKPGSGTVDVEIKESV